LAVPPSEKDLKRLEDLKARFREDPENPRTRDDLIEGYTASGQALTAAELLRAETDPSDGAWDPLRACAALFLQGGDAGRAAEALNASGSLHEDRWEFWHLRGRCLEGLGRIREAMDEQRRAARMAPEEAEPRFRMGLISLELGEEGVALAHFQDALERDPGMGRALVNMGLLYDRMGESDRALEMFRRAVELEPDNLEGHLNLGVLYAELGYAQDAAQEFLKAVDLDSRCAEAHFNLGLLREESDPEEALQRLRKTLALDAGHREARFQMGRLCYRRGLYPAAIKSLRACLAADDNDTGALFHLALSYNKLDRPDETIRFLEELLKLEPDNAQAHFYLGVAFDKKGDYGNARRAYQKADELARHDEGHAPGVE
jgi:tetratricopeptide (TPR) repeat protein